MSFFFFFNDTATTEIYTLSLHDALPISRIHPSAPRRAQCQLGPRRRSITNRPPGGHVFADRRRGEATRVATCRTARCTAPEPPRRDRKSTRLNSSHDQISYAVFCLKKKTPCIAPHAGPI